MAVFHTPVLINEVLSFLKVVPGQIYVDATLGNGGHTLEILKRGGIVYGLEQDPVNLKIATSRINHENLGDNFHPLHGNFNQIAALLKTSIGPVSGLLADLGLSSGQQTSSGRGFSFNDRESLDMRLDPQSAGLTAESVVNTFSYPELFDIFSRIGQEVYSKPLALAIITERQKQPITSALRLAEIIRKFYSHKGIRGRLDPATRIFMSLRIYVNQEFENLRSLLDSTVTSPLFRGATVCLITFHSGEDRIVKQFIRSQNLQNTISVLTPHAVLPDRDEIARNPLARSSRLRSYKINT